ncbi:NmrA-like family protein [Abortiporus biennis]|nr:NmrA-like family protein [Abortiporus biennis]
MVKYVVTGATGALGSRVFKHLLDRVPASDVIVSLYNPSGATPEILSSGVEIRKGDYADPKTLESAFAGATKLLLVSYPSIAYGIRVTSHEAAIDAAIKTGTIQHIYYTSLAFAGDSKAAVMQAHIETEAYLKKSGIKYTIIREGIYNESFPLYFGSFDPMDGKDEVLIPDGDGGIAWVCRDDLGEGTAKVMVAESDFDNKTILLSGQQSVTLTSLAQKISKIIGRNLTLKIVPVEEYVKNNLGKSDSWPESLLRDWATTFPAIKRGECATVDPLLRNLLGRDLKTIDETLEEMLGSKDASAQNLKRYGK